MERRDPSQSSSSGGSSWHGSKSTIGANSIGHRNGSRNGSDGVSAALDTIGDAGDGGNIDSFLDDGDDEGWHSADLVAGFSPTSPTHVMAATRPVYTRQHDSNRSQGASAAQRNSQDLLGGDLDWAAWETPRGPTPSLPSGSERQSHHDLDTTFGGLRVDSNAARHSSIGPNRRASPPIIDLRDMEKQLEARRSNQHSQPASAIASSSKHGMLDAADLSFFEAFDSSPQEVMNQSRNASRDRNKLQGEQLINMAEAQHSPLDLTTPLPIQQSGNDYFGEEQSSSPVNIGLSSAAPDTKHAEGHKGSWTDAAGSWAGSFRRTLGSIRGHLPTAKDFYVDDDEGLDLGSEEAVKKEEKDHESFHQDASRRAEQDLSRPHHTRKLRHLQDYSQSTPFGGPRSPPTLSPPTLRTNSGLHGMSFGHHSTAPIPGAPAFNPNAGRNWNTGSWSLTSKEETERAKKPIPVKLRGRREETQDVVEEDLAARLTAYLPRRLQLGKAWKLLYSSDQDGISLGTLYHKVEIGLAGSANGRSGMSPGGVADAEGWLRGASETTRAAVTGVPRVGSGLNIKEAGLVVAVRDARDRLFGAFVNERLRAQPTYYGSGECFLWKQTDSGAIKTYKWTGRNDYMILTEAHYLSFGGGEGRYGLWLDKRLEQGVSSPCPAFNNDILCDGRDEATHDGDKEGRFECIVLEVWACGID